MDIQGLINTLTTVAYGALVLGIALFLRGLYGNRVDNHRYCRDCGFDLSGTTSKGCPECGNYIAWPRGVRYGRHERATRWLVTGIALLCFGGAIAGASLFAQLRQVDWLRYQSVSWLLDRSDDYDLRAEEAMRELLRRLESGEMSEAELRQALDVMLAVCEDKTRILSEGYAGFIERAFVTNQLSREDWLRYLKPQLQVGLRVRSRVRVTDDLPAELDNEAARDRFSRTSPFSLSTTVASVSFAGRQIVPSPSEIERYSNLSNRELYWMEPGVGGLVRRGYQSIKIANEQMQQLHLGKPGRGTLTVELTAQVRDADLQVWATWPVKLSAEVLVVGKDELPYEAIDTPELAAKLKASLHARFGVDGDRYSFEAEVKDTPVPFLFHVHVRTEEYDSRLTTVESQSQVTHDSGFLNPVLAEALRGKSKVDLLLEPATDLVSQMIDYTQLWSAPILLEDVPIGSIE